MPFEFLWMIYGAQILKENGGSLALPGLVILWSINKPTRECKPLVTLMKTTEENSY